jgi:oligopeptide/dipeptide ABC transporter ATP-binding protein
MLEVEGLRTEIATEAGALRAVDGVSFSLAAGEVMGLVGESGCGKSMTALSLMRLLPANARVTGAAVRLAGTDLLALPEAAMRALRGDRIAMIFQDPMAALNPVFTVGEQIAETLRHHRGLDSRSAWQQAERLLDRVGIAEADRRARSYPHEFSGGMRQRVMIAIAISCGPDLLIADEPTTALDVTVEQQILTLLDELRRDSGTAILLITHNLVLAGQHCDRIAVMYAGQIVEQGPADSLLAAPLHPYSQGLLAAMPRGPISEGRIAPIAGLPPVLFGPRQGCSFAPRCPHRFAPCATNLPELVESGPGRTARCFLLEAGAR